MTKSWQSESVVNDSRVAGLRKRGGSPQQTWLIPVSPAAGGAEGKLFRREEPITTTRLK